MRTVVSGILVAALVVPAAALSYTPRANYPAKVVYENYECERTTDLEQAARYECKHKPKGGTFEGKIRFPKWLEVTEIGKAEYIRVRTAKIASIAVLGCKLRRENCLESREIEIYMTDGTMIVVGYVRIEMILMPPKEKQLDALMIASGPIMSKKERVVTRVDFDHVKKAKRRK